MAQAAKRDRQSGRSSADGVAASVPSGEQPESEVALGYFDREYDDFEAWAELSPYDAEQFKTSRGPYRGRWRSAYATDRALMAHWGVNCGMYHRVAVPEGWFGLCVSLGPPGARANGVELGRNRLVLSGPGSELEVDIPAEGGEFVVLSLDQGNLEASVCSHANSGRIPLGRGTVSTVRTDMAGALTESTLALLRILGRGPDRRPPESVATTLFSAIVEGLELEAGLGGDHGGESCRPSFATFARARRVLAGMERFDAAALAAAVGRCPRAIQMAFAEHARTTPYRYFVSLRLHRARTVLMADPGDRAATIGDIAAAHGFWDWSRFTQMYRRQFGETPSQTRARFRSRSPRNRP